MPTQDAFLIVHNWATNRGSFDCCANLLNLLQVGMTLSGATTISAVVQGQIGDPMMPLGYLMDMMQKEVLLASLPGLAPKLVIIDATSNPAMENLLTKIGEVQLKNLEKEETWHAEKEALEPLTAQYPEKGQYKILRTLMESDPDAPETVPEVYHKIANLTKKLGTQRLVQFQVNALARQLDIQPPTVQIGCSECFVSLLFHGHDHTISTGCLPFGVIPSKMVNASNKVLLCNIVQTNFNYESYAENVYGIGKTELNFLKKY